MARLDRLVVGGERNHGLDTPLRFRLSMLEALEKLFGISNFEVILRHFLLVRQVHVAIGNPGVV